ncbi:zinc finger C2HC domain-containing protein 1A-like, partial [Pollicipes pollicipes]|uniref:zinc finger C2HC domain-containing protein 1A-like n=1 Tax=Pollicipes pollicipes TaxID=41117 RepID=UPI0018857C1E
RQEHEAICGRLAQRRRTTFDSRQHRLAGTEHGPLFRRAQHRPEPPARENRWRQRHEEFIGAIRAAKQVQRHLAAGGRLQDLPPPPPSDYSDYVQCPYCSRKFNEAAAERHIPRCQFYEHNKPGPSGAGRGRQSGPSRSPQPSGRHPGPSRSPQPSARQGPARPPHAGNQPTPARSPRPNNRPGPTKATVRRAPRGK